MGFLAPKLPPFNPHFWYWGRRAERLKPICQHWGEYGTGLPVAGYLLYLIKLAGYAAGALLFVMLTPGIGALTEIGRWWTEPVVFQKVLIWSLLFEVVGLGCGFGPLTMRFLPPLGGILHWLRPGTIRLPPWPGKIPLTRGTARTVVDVLLFVCLLAAAIWLLLSPASLTSSDTLGAVLSLDPARIAPLVILLPLIGLRDKTIFLAARSEHYWVALAICLLPVDDMLITSKIFLVLLWWSAATSTLSKTYPMTIAALLSNIPITPPPLRRTLFRSFPRDMRASRTASTVAWTTTLVQFVAPLLLLVSSNSTVMFVAVGVLAGFHLAIVCSTSVGVPLEWNSFIVFSVCYLFLGHPSANMIDAERVLWPALVAVPLVILLTWGHLRPDLVSSHVAMRYSGNWATSMWALKPSALAKIDENIVKYSGFAKEQLVKLYGVQVAEVFTHKIYAFRALHHQGRGLFSLLPRAAGPEHEDAYVIEGELVVGPVLGWAFGEGHLHNEGLISALQERCHFEPGEVRVVVLESHPLGSDRQSYRLVDAAIGVFETGYVSVQDMMDRQPWEIEGIPTVIVNQTLQTPLPTSTPPPADEPTTPDIPVIALEEPLERERGTAQPRSRIW